MLDEVARKHNQRLLIIVDSAEKLLPADTGQSKVNIPALDLFTELKPSGNISVRLVASDMKMITGMPKSMFRCDGDSVVESI